MDIYDINFTLNYSISKQTKDSNGKNISIPISVNSHSFIYHTSSSSLEELIKKLKDYIPVLEEQWILNTDSQVSPVQIAEENLEPSLQDQIQQTVIV